MRETTPVSTILRRVAPIQLAAWRLMLEKHQDFMQQFELAFRRRHALSLNEFDVLINADPDEPIRQRELLASLVLSRSALSRLLSRLEARDLVTQEADPDDQRGVLVTLTEAGVTLREEAMATNAEIIMAGFAGVSTDEAGTIFELVSRIRPRPLFDDDADSTNPAGN